jgi:hypothetical protein
MGEEEDGRKEDIFGLPKMSTNMEIGVSFTLFLMGLLLVFANIFEARYEVAMAPGLVGILMLMTAYFFAIESVRELEEKDHFLSRRLMKDE